MPMMPLRCGARCRRWLAKRFYAIADRFDAGHGGTAAREGLKSSHALPPPSRERMGGTTGMRMPSIQDH